MEESKISDLGFHMIFSPNSTAMQRHFCVASVYGIRLTGASSSTNPSFELTIKFTHTHRFSSFSSDGFLTREHQLITHEQQACHECTLKQFLFPDRSEPAARWLISSMPITNTYVQDELVKFVSSCARSASREAWWANPVGLTRLKVEAEIRLLTSMRLEEKDWRHPVSKQIAEASLSEDCKDDGKYCSICLEEFEPRERVTRMPCLHCYHKEGIVKWLTEQSNSCPLCRLKI